MKSISGLLVTAIILLGLVPFVPLVEAANPTIAASVASNSCYVQNGKTFNCNISATSGDLLIVFAGCVSSTCAGAVTISDSQSNPYSALVAVGSACTGKICNESVYTATATATGTDTVTFTSANSLVVFAGDVYDINGGTLTGLVYSTGASDNTNVGTVGSYSAWAGGIVLAGVVMNVGSGAWTAGSGYTLITSQPQYSTLAYWQASEYEAWTSGTTTSFISLANGTPGFAEVSVSIATSGGGGGGGTTIVQACTWFQWQCWWYPFLFFMLYTVVFMMVGAFGGASGRGMNFLLLAGLTNAALAATVMGMLSFTVPLLLIVLTVVYAVRIH